MEPQKGWSHTCCKVSISNKSGVFIQKPTITYLTMPPLNVELEPIDVKNRYGANAGLKLRVPKQTNTNEISEAAEHTYALILSGGWNKYSNKGRYWNDCSFIYQSLRNKYNIPKDNIYVAMADGTNPEADMYDPVTRQYVSSPLDLDFDEQDDIQYAATKANVSNILSDLQERMTEEDNLFIYVIDHGGTTDHVGGSYICLWNGDKLHDSELAEMLELFNVRTINVLLGQCYSGGFVEELEGNGRVIATACSGSESSWACDGIPYDEFVYHWTCAVNELDKDTAVVQSDVDKNGHVSMLEAFRYAQKYDTRDETPQYSSFTPSVGEDLAFNNIPDAVDLYIRDDIYDTGKEPNNYRIYSKYHPFNSPDIYMRLQDDGFECEENETPNVEGLEQELQVYIYAKVWNRGTKTYNTKDKYLHLFWTNSNNMYLSPLNFWGHSSFPEDYGEHIGVIKITENIAPGEFVKLRKSSLVQPEWYDNSFGQGYLGIALLGVITDSRLLDEIPTDHVSPYTKIKLESNDIAMKNECVISYDDPTRIPDSLLIDCAYERDFDLNAKLDVMPLQIKAILDPHIFNGFMVNGVTPAPINPMAGYQIPLENDTQISNINLGEGEVSTIKLTFKLDANAADDELNGKSFTILQKDRETGEIVGGKTYRFVKKASAAHVAASVSTPKISNMLLDANSSQMNIGFSEPVEASALQISTSYPQAITTERELEDGATNTTVDIPQNYNGVLVVNLLKDGKIIDSKKIMK